MNVHFSGTAKRIVASIAAVAALGSMAACGSNGASNGGSDDELTVSYWDDEQDSIKEFISRTLISRSRKSGFRVMTTTPSSIK